MNPYFLNEGEKVEMPPISKLFYNVLVGKAMFSVLLIKAKGTLKVKSAKMVSMCSTTYICVKKVQES